jgi:hypothetical protein
MTLRIFISYARKDRQIAQSVRQDLTRARGSVWIDDELTGGQAWWNTILENIRTCDLFVFLLSPDSLRSKACQSELRYALQSGRPLLPVMVSPVSVQLAPREIADAQIVDYTERTADSAVALIAAVTSQPPAPPTPDPPPESPPPPLSYMNPYREQIQADSLAYRDQAQLVLALRGHLQVDEEHDTARDLLTELRRRPDIAESVGRDIDQILGIARPSDSPAPSRAAAQTAEPQGHTSQAVSAAAPDLTPATAAEPAAAHTPGPTITPPPWIGQAGATPPVFAPTGAPTGTPPPASPSAAPAAWQPDPTGRYEYRYWDGTRWTDHVSRGGTRATDAVGSAGTGPPRFAASPAAPADGTSAGAFTGGALAGLIVAAVFTFGLVGIIVGGINLKHKARRGQAQVLLWVGIAVCAFWAVSFFSSLGEQPYYY